MERLCEVGRRVSNKRSGLHPPPAQEDREGPIRIATRCAGWACLEKIPWIGGPPGHAFAPSPRGRTRWPGKTSSTGALAWSHRQCRSRRYVCQKPIASKMGCRQRFALDKRQRLKALTSENLPAQPGSCSAEILDWMLTPAAAVAGEPGADVAGGAEPGQQTRSTALLVYSAPLASWWACPPNGGRGGVQFNLLTGQQAAARG